MQVMRPCLTCRQDLESYGLHQCSMAQEGLANVCLVGANITVVAAKVESNIPRKRGAASAGYDKALDRFFDKVSTRLSG